MIEVTIRQLKRVQVILTVLISSLGLTSGILLNKVFYYFQKNCILNANVSVEVEREESTQKIIVRSVSTWGNPCTCSFVNFEGVVVFIVSFIWLWFYLHMENMGSSSETSINQYLQESEPDGELAGTVFILPSILTNSILCLFSIVRASYLTDGYQKFCSSICIFNNNKCDKYTDVCENLQDSTWIIPSKETTEPYAFSDAMEAAIALSWLESLALACHVLTVMADLYMSSNPPGSSISSINTLLGMESIMAAGSSSMSNSKEVDLEDESDDVEHLLYTNPLSKHLWSEDSFQASPSIIDSKKFSKPGQHSFTAVKRITTEPKIDEVENLTESTPELQSDSSLKRSSLH